ncbi:MAG: hypothetical protein MSH22_02210 [Spirochaetia bacterium]|nr:hypothetical protein [Spirochaetia bacterium]
MSKSKFFDKIVLAKEEREVEDVYNEGINLYFLKNEGTISHPYKCDGLVDQGLFLRLIIEYKYNEELHNPVSRAKVLIQVIYYIKQFELNGDRLPNVVMVGDKDEVFVMHTNPLLKYLDENVDWTIAPSNAHDKNPSLLVKISKDTEISPYVYDINEDFSFKDVADKILEIAKNIIRKVRVTEHNISRIFDDFSTRVLRDTSKISPNDLVGIFINSIIDRENCYKHPNNPNILVCYNKQYQINGTYYDTFFKHFEKEYSPKDKNKFTEISDRLIEDAKRRKNGEFFTPTLFTDYAHKMLSEELGEDWKEKYIVWDCCWGTGNLTRDYRFKELYASTLEQAELDCGRRYNPEATKFVFDFLNDDIAFMGQSNGKLPKNLYKALEEKRPIVFFINPPYATSSSNDGKGKGNGVCMTRLYDKMVKDDMQEACKNLFSQFMYRICLIKKHFNLEDIAIGLFCNPIYLCGSTFKEFRKFFFNEFEYRQGILFNASCFADVSDTWGIDFTVWKAGVTENKTEFVHNLLEEKDEELISTGSKKIYNIDFENNAKDWIKKPIESITTKKIKYPPLSTAINVKAGKSSNTSIFENSLGCYFNVGNDVYQSTQRVAIFTSCDNSNANGISIVSENFERIVTIFSARRLISNNWTNHIDNYLEPNTNHPKWNEFYSDSIIFSLFESKSQQSSLRNIEYKGHNYNIKNNFFFMSKKEIMDLADKYNYDYTYNDAKVSEERYVYKLLSTMELSEEAKNVLEQAKKLVIKTFEYREIFNQQYPEYQIMNWDCGWFQIKGILKEYFAEDLNCFSELFKKLSDKMIPVVYELGFLK